MYVSFHKAAGRELRCLPVAGNAGVWERAPRNWAVGWFRGRLADEDCYKSRSRGLNAKDRRGDGRYMGHEAVNVNQCLVFALWRTPDKLHAVQRRSGVQERSGGAAASIISAAEIVRLRRDSLLGPGSRCAAHSLSGRQGRTPHSTRCPYTQSNRAASRSEPMIRSAASRAKAAGPLIRKISPLRRAAACTAAVRSLRANS